MVLKQIDKRVITDVIKLLQLFNSEKLKKIIAVLKKADYSDNKKISCRIKYDRPMSDERLTDIIADTPIPRLEQFHFDLELSPTEFYFYGNFQEIWDDGDFLATKFHKYKMNDSTSDGDLGEFRGLIKMALDIPRVKNKVKISVPRPLKSAPQSFQDFLKIGHRLEVFWEDQPLNSFTDYMRFKVKTMAKRKRDEPLNFKIVFREQYEDVLNECDGDSELEFNLKNGKPFELLEIKCDWSQFSPTQYQSAAEVFNYIRNVTEKYFMLKKATTKRK